MAKVIVYHDSYGCDTGCCGHYVQLTNDKGVALEQFEFIHPYSGDKLEFAKRLITNTWGEEHVKDLDWENCVISDD